MIKGVVFDFDGTLTELTLDFPDMRENLDRLISKRIPREISREYEGLLMLEKIAAVEERLGHEGVFLGPFLHYFECPVNQSSGQALLSIPHHRVHESLDQNVVIFRVRQSFSFRNPTFTWHCLPP